MRWTKDPKVETNLRDLGIKFEYVTGLKMADIDREEGMRRQVRVAARLTEDTLFRYAGAMEKPNAAFPAPILQRERKRLWPISGNHRLGAADLVNVGDVDAYCVEVFDPMQLDLLLRLVNTWEAVVGMSREEAVLNARYMMETHGMTADEAARAFSLRPEALLRAGRAARIKEVLDRVGVPANGFAQNTLNALHTIPNQVALQETAQLLHTYSVKGKEAEAVCTDVAKQATEAMAKSEVKRWEDIFQARERAKRKRAKKGESKPVSEFRNRERLVYLLTGLSRYLEGVTTAAQAQILAPEHAELVVRYWTQCERGMRKLLTGGAR